jgi:hypothetical protein
MRELLIVLGLLVPDLTERVATEAAVTVNTRAPDVVTDKCCGLCVNGIVTHGDGHKTPCRCPPDCKCKAKKAEPPTCVSGTCALKR